mmetsp:Transcript_9569/g.23843  ORF Transcript_9569/g.23843 Transcript_9569/m.23843 type:complete len:87 (-) Transcript_9569:450-710(-)
MISAVSLVTLPFPDFEKRRLMNVHRYLNSSCSLGRPGGDVKGRSNGDVTSSFLSERSHWAAGIVSALREQENETLQVHTMHRRNTL